MLMLRVTIKHLTNYSILLVATIAIRECATETHRQQYTVSDLCATQYYGDLLIG